MTHADLVKRAASWLDGTQRCVLVLTEYRAETCAECPDAIGWSPGGYSVLVECKTSVADFRADARKEHRRGVGMGAERWYLTPPGLLSLDMLPDGWGLIEAGRVVRVKRRPVSRVPDVVAERNILLNAVRRATGYCSQPVLRSGIGA